MKSHNSPPGVEKTKTFQVADFFAKTFQVKERARATIGQNTKSRCMGRR